MLHRRTGKSVAFTEKKNVYFYHSSLHMKKQTNLEQNVIMS